MRRDTVFLVSVFAATVPAANWMIGNVGWQCVPDGPCLIPVGFGLLAPSGVLMVGASLVLRDLVQEAGGVGAALAAIAIGGVLSWFVAPAALVLASVSAFVLAELADFAVYTPLRTRSLVSAVLVSGTVGSLVDSAMFLWIAFGSLDHLAGQVVGKLWLSVLAVPVIALLRMRMSSRLLRLDPHTISTASHDN